MAVNAASNAAQKLMRDEPTSIPTQHTDQSRSDALNKGETMLALTWQGKTKVEIRNRDTECPEGLVKKMYDLEPLGWDVCFDVADFRYAQPALHKVMRAVALETDTPETLNECITVVRKHGRISIAADYAGLANGFNIGAVMEKGIMLKGNGQAPAQMYMEKILNEFIVTDKFDPTLILTHRFDITEMDKLYHAFDQKLFDEEKGVGILKTFVQTKFSNPPGPGMPTLSKVPNPK